MSQFQAEVFQNPYLPQGSREVHAIMTINAGSEVGIAAASATERVFGIVCDVSGSMQGAKIQAAKAAMTKLIELLPATAYFFVVTGNSHARIIVPLMPATVLNKEQAYRQIRSIAADGGTCISTWLTEARNQFQQKPNAIRNAVLLTDGQNSSSDEGRLATALAACEGLFQCDCRGVGTDWKVTQLQQISSLLLGTTDIIPEAAMIEADFNAILNQAMNKNIQDVALRLWTPQGAKTLFCKQVSPQIVDVSDRRRKISAQIVEYPTGSWGADESRDYHFCIEVNPGNVGDEMLAGRASLMCTIDSIETKIAEARILAIWTDDEAKSAKLDRRVAHYTGQAELAQSIQDGLEARARGNVEVATAKLGRAVKLAHESGNEATAKLLRTVVDIEDAPTGTVRLKRQVNKADEMALETRSTKTTRIAKS